MCLTACDNHKRMIQIRQHPLVYELWSSRQPKQLNEEQKDAVETAVKSKFQLIQGPPGKEILCLYTHLCILNQVHAHGCLQLVGKAVYLYVCLHIYISKINF